MKRIPELDGIRGIAIIAVFLNHTQPVLSGGFLGVDLFFALSGYLITSILLGEFGKTGTISLRSFYYRRALRLLPALLVLLIVCAPWVSRRTVLAALFYFANWQSFESLGPLVHTWSLSVEEQFYIAWPLILLLLLRLKFSKSKIAIGLTIVIVTIFIWRLCLLKSGASWERAYKGTDTHTEGLLIGCVVALVPDYLRAVSVRFTPLASWSLLWLFFSASWVTAAANAIALTMAALCGGIIILAAQSRPSLLQSLSLVYLGQRSYSLYLWHYPIVRYVMPRCPGSSIVKVAFAAMVTLVAAEISFRFIEQPFLKLKDQKPNYGNSASAEVAAVVPAD